MTLSRPGGRATGAVSTRLSWSPGRRPTRTRSDRECPSASPPGRREACAPAFSVQPHVDSLGPPQGLWLVGLVVTADETRFAVIREADNTLNLAFLLLDERRPL